VNIFYLSPDPQKCAEMHLDKHVVKMIIEYAQLMSTAHRVLDGEEYIDLTANGRKYKRWRMADKHMENGLMKSCHVHHPSNVWVRASKANYIWLNRMWNYLLLEYTHRYGKRHACADRVEFLIDAPKNIPIVSFTPPTPAMPDECKIPGDSLASYHKYYIEKKVSFAKWTKREVPLWFQNGINTNNANLQLL
jgi:hypothetical protein